ncbi:DUF2059 domain-containing protein [Acinetobacter sp. ME22]|uniref:DUF2059 domain-containing protein n=1 Tax=Acinetobacter sp. ME22 TaxID=2904802 RepID=UPI001EDB732D|nr:DUF2059 domain-containing protein [Acinetobacter sp. ME22]MCG2573178.1 DUF2059 domain-containing protein [Acinetobacter sp. ME22]
MLKKIALSPLIIACFCSYTISKNTFATPAQSSSVNEMMNLINAEQLFKATINSSQPRFQQLSEKMIKDYTGHQTFTEQDQIAVKKLSNLLTNTVENSIQQAKPIEIIKNIYMEQFSEEEIQAYIRFLKSPEGQSINQKMPIILQTTIQEMDQMGTKIFKDPKLKQQITQQIVDILKPLPRQSIQNK